MYLYFVARIHSSQNTLTSRVNVMPVANRSSSHATHKHELAKHSRHIDVMYVFQIPLAQLFDTADTRPFHNMRRGEAARLLL